MKNKFSISVTLALILSMLITSLALADDVSNNLDSDVDSTLESMSLIVGGANGFTDLYIVEKNGDGKQGCNLTGQTTLVVNIVNSDPNVATVSPTQLTFTNCEHVGEQLGTGLTITPVGEGSTTISLSLVSNTTAGTFNLAPASFTVIVSVPPSSNTPPTLILPDDMTVEGNTTGGATVTFGVSATDAEDDPDPTPTCSPASGDFFPLGETTVTCSVTDSGGLSASGSFKVTVVDTTPPSITCSANIDGIVGQVVDLGSPTVSDIVDASPTVGNDAPGSFRPGTTTVTWTATDASLNSASCSQTVTLKYVFLGFFQPVDNLPITNKAKAGQAIPFKWVLQDANGNFVSNTGVVTDWGFGSGVSCGGSVDSIESYDTSGNSGLRYDFDANQFVLTAKSEKAWSSSCKVFFLTLDDGTTHQAIFNFVK